MREREIDKGKKDEKKGNREGKERKRRGGLLGKSQVT